MQRPWRSPSSTLSNSPRPATSSASPSTPRPSRQPQKRPREGEGGGTEEAEDGRRGREAGTRTMHLALPAIDYLWKIYTKDCHSTFTTRRNASSHVVFSSTIMADTEGSSSAAGAAGSGQGPPHTPEAKGTAHASSQQATPRSALRKKGGKGKGQRKKGGGDERRVSFADASEVQLFTRGISVSAVPSPVTSVPIGLNTPICKKDSCRGCSKCTVCLRNSSLCTEGGGGEEPNGS